eukprot:COSAG02_NODE_2194_length_9554_cov_12.883659_1_plen_62_part_00
MRQSERMDLFSSQVKFSAFTRVLMIWVELSDGFLADERPAHEKCSHDAVYFIRRSVSRRSG